jgi:hypothetical protein
MNPKPKHQNIIAENKLLNIPRNATMPAVMTQVLIRRLFKVHQGLYLPILRMCSFFSDAHDQIPFAI